MKQIKILALLALLTLPACVMTKSEEIMAKMQTKADHCMQGNEIACQDYQILGQMLIVEEQRKAAASNALLGAYLQHQMTPQRPTGNVQCVEQGVFLNCTSY